MFVEFEKKLYGQRKEDITPLEINKLFKSNIDDTFNISFYRLLERKIINPDIAILQAISYAYSKEYLIPIALCLRFGADSNMYIDTPNLGTMHIIGYTYLTLFDRVDSTVFDTIIIMLLSKGARTSMPMFDNDAGKIVSGKESSQGLSVLEWLEQNNYDTYNIDMVDKESLVILSILLNLPSYMSRNYKSKDMTLAIRSFSNIEEIPLSDEKYLMDNIALYESVKYFNSDAFEILINRGLSPSYLLINKILVSLRDNQSAIIIKELEKMLIVSVSVGTQLDQEQYNILVSSGSNILETVMKEYEEPYWKKICKSNRITSPKSLLRLARYLNIDTSLNTKSICNNIAALAKADKEALKEAGRKRQQLRISSNLGTINEFINGKQPVLPIRNKSLLQYNPLDCNDSDIAFYRDEQGVVWCFTKDMFISLIETGINPYNSTKLPISFRESLKHNNYDPIVTFPEALDSLSNKDTIVSNNKFSFLLDMGIKYRVGSDTIINRSKEDITAAFRSIGYEVDLISLTSTHALITSSIIIEYMNEQNSNSVKDFYESFTVF